MCGYCIESSALTSALAHRRGLASADIDDRLVAPGVLQEAASWQELLQGRFKDHGRLGWVAKARRHEDAVAYTDSLDTDPGLTLERYLDGWIRSNRWSDGEFAAQWQSVLVAIARCAKRLDVPASLREIALSDPARTPDFSAVDLWIQRRAVRACFLSKGTSFLEQHVDRLRLAPAAALLVSGTATAEEFAGMRPAVMAGGLFCDDEDLRAEVLVALDV